MQLIRSVWPKLNKQDNIDAYMTQLRARDFHCVTATITETICLTCYEWEDFVHNLLRDREWLAEKGGSCDRAQHHCIHVVAPAETEQESVSILVDPQGYNYARYVGFYLSPENVVTRIPGLPTLQNCMDTLLLGRSYKDRVLEQAAAAAASHVT